MRTGISTGLLAALVVVLSVVFTALTIADAAEHAPAVGGFVQLLP